MVVDLIKSGVTANVHMQPLLDDIIAILQQQDWRSSVSHFLANLGHTPLSFDWVVVDSVTPPLGLLLAEDARGCCLSRLVP